MQHAQHNHRLRRAAAYVTLVVALGIVSLTVTQCRIVGDNLTGVGPFRSAPTTCIKDCNDQFKVLYDLEQKTHDTNVEGCKALPQPDKDICLAEEGARHVARKNELAQLKIDCQNGCHHQGAGIAG